MTNTVNINAGYNSISDSVVVTIYVIDDVDGTIIANDLTSGFAKLQFIKNSITEDVSPQVNFDSTLVDNDGLLNLVFNHPFKKSNLKVFVEIDINSSIINNIVDVLNESTADTYNIPLQSQPDWEDLGELTRNDLHEEIKVKETIKSVVQNTDLNFKALFLDFTTEVPLMEGVSDIVYAGGGGRYGFYKIKNIVSSANDDVFIQQPDNKPLYELNSSFFVEATSTNLLTDPVFSVDMDSDNIPDNYELIANDSVVNHKLVNNVTDSAKTWECTVSQTDVNLSNPANIFFQNKFDTIIDPGRYLTFSTYLRIEYLDSDTVIKTGNIILNFKDSSGSIIGNKVQVIDIANLSVLPGKTQRRDLFNEFKLVQLNVDISDYPANTDKVSFQFEFGELNLSDTVKFSVLLPQLEQNQIATTRILQGQTRTLDTAVIPQNGSLDINSGEIQITFKPNHSIPFTDIYFFDTRHETTLLNGITAYHRASDGKLILGIADGIGTQILSSPGLVNFTIGEEQELRIKWKQNNRQIILNDTNLITDTSAYNLPTGINTYTYLGSDSMQTADTFINAEILNFGVNRFS